MRFPDDQAALSAGSRGRLNGYVAPGVDVVDQAIVLLPVYVLRWCRTLWQGSDGVTGVGTFKLTSRLTFSIMQTKLIVEPMSTCSSPEPRMNASGTTT